MAEDVFADYSAPLDMVEMRRLLRFLEAALSRASGELPQQEVLRLWWGTANAGSGPIPGPIGSLYGSLLDWQDGIAPFPAARKDMQEQVRRLWKILGADDG